MVLKTTFKQVHFKIKDLKCDKCDYACSTRDSLYQHIKYVHNKIKHVNCTNCEFVCSSNSNLSRHIKTVHARPTRPMMDKRTSLGE